jgi:phosphohistidine phosphatase
VTDDRRATQQLYLVRHADAGDPGAWSGDDDLRPLSPKGRRQAARLGAFLADNHVIPDVIVSSPKVRARETAELVAASLGLEVSIDDRLAGSADLDVAERILVDHDDPDRPMLVGHDPDFSEIVAELCLTHALPMRKGAFARLDAERPFRPGAGILRWLVPPGLIRSGERSD